MTKFLPPSVTRTDNDWINWAGQPLNLTTDSPNGRHVTTAFKSRKQLTHLEIHSVSAKESLSGHVAHQALGCEFLSCQ